MKKFLQDLIARKKQEMTNLEERSNKSEDINEVRSIGETMKALRDEISEAESKLAELEQEEQTQEENARSKKADLEARSQVLETYTSAETRSEENESKELEQRGKDLREGRTVTVATGKALLPKHTGTQLNDTFKPVSTLVDLVSYEVLEGGESYSEAYVKSYATGGITEEGANYTDAEPVFGYADMNKVKITAYAEINEEVKKLSNIDYASKVEEACLVALKKKLSEQILNGTGTKQLTGIFASPVAIDSDKDIELTAIDNKTLNELVFNYGGDEDVEGMATTILNKKTLKEISEVAKTDGSLFYNIDLANRTINTVPYLINSNVADFAGATTGKYVFAFGDPKSYKVTQFSPVEIVESTDFKFKQGMICFKASMFVGGNVIKQDGFLRAKKKIVTAG